MKRPHRSTAKESMQAHDIQFGRGGETRTLGFQTPSLAVYQLTYTPGIAASYLTMEKIRA